MAAKGMVAIVTGCNTGIGKETVLGLVKEGTKVYMACRDLSRAEKARLDILEIVSTASVICRECDLADFDSIRKFVKEFLSEENRLDILINNAGVMFGPFRRTKQGIEQQLGVNHVGHFLLTDLLLETIKDSAPSRIVVVSSIGHTQGKIHFEDINFEKSFCTATAYCQSKLANVLFANELAERLQGTGVTVNSLHPGAVKTELARDTPFVNNFVGNCIMKHFFKTPEEGAATSLYVALDPSVALVTGKYFSDCKQKEPAKQALDMVVAKKLWILTEELIRSPPSVENPSIN